MVLWSFQRKDVVLAPYKTNGIVTTYYFRIAVLKRVCQCNIQILIKSSFRQIPCGLLIIAIVLAEECLSDRRWFDCDVGVLDTGPAETQ